MGERKIRCRLISITLITLISITTLTACNKKSSHTTPPPGTKESGEARLPDGKGGTYKTGNPYMVAGRWYTPMKGVKNYDATGIASWYGDDFHGKLTANGERYDMYTLSAAHTTLPLPTLLRVTNLENGKSVVVRVNDRGPFVKNRLIDLSYAAAKQLDYINQGTTRVRIQTLDQKLAEKPAVAAPVINNNAMPAPVAAPAIVKGSSAAGIYVQLGAFGSQENANRLRQSLVGQYPSTALHPRRVANEILYRVRIGPFSEMKKVEETMLSLQKNGYQQAAVVIE